ncbi:MAG: GNAT family N-acetyltransferase, partial [Chloroflexota bacterium]
MSATESLPSWDVRPYEPGDEEQLVLLFSEVFGRTVSTEWWRWKLKGLPSPVENVWVAIDEAGAIVGQYAGIPRKIKLGSREHMVMISVDTMTSGRFRRRGVLTKLATVSYARWAAEGVAAVLGLPNEQWGSRTGALGWQSLFRLEWLRMPLRIERLAYKVRTAPAFARTAASALTYPASLAWYDLRRRRLSGKGAHLAIGAVDPGYAAVDALWLSASPLVHNALARDGAWLEWRYTRTIDHQYRVLLARREGIPAGYIAYRVDGRDYPVGYVADLFCTPGDRDVSSRLLLAALDDMWSRKATTVRIAASPGSWLHSFACWAGFTPLHAGFNFDMVRLNPTLDVAELRDSAAWYLCAGD